MQNDALGVSGGLCVSEKTTPILQQILQDLIYDTDGCYAISL